MGMVVACSRACGDDLWLSVGEILEMRVWEADVDAIRYNTISTSFTLLCANRRISPYAIDVVLLPGLFRFRHGTLVTSSLALPVWLILSCSVCYKSIP